jgi:hypothetical protein
MRAHNVLKSMRVIPKKKLLDPEYLYSAPWLKIFRQFTYPTISGRGFNPFRSKKFLKSKHKEYSFSYGISSIPHIKKRSKGGEDCHYTDKK